MTDAALLERSWKAGANRGVDAWLDGWSDHGWSGAQRLLLVLFLFVAVWTIFQIVSYASIDLHPDLTEVYAWSRHPSPGYYKHPPLNALIAWAWFSLFPARDWAFHLLAMTNAAFALFASDLIARRYLTGDKRFMALLLLMLTPFYQFHGQRFSTNQTLLATWPLATWCFLRAFERRTLAWSLAAGAAAALAMLGKYYSIYLLASFPIAVLAHPDGMAYLRSKSPWISIAAGLAVMAPNLYWLATTGFQPFHYAYAVHGAPSLGAVLKVDALYVAGALAYVSLLIAVYLIAARPSLHALHEALWPTDPRRRMLIWLLATPLLLSPLSALAIRFEPTPLWTMQAWFLLPVVLLSSPQIAIRRPAAKAVAGLVLAIAAGCLAAAPALALRRHQVGDRDGRDYYRPASEALTRLWREKTGRPLKIVQGDGGLAVAATFYSPDHPDSAPGWSFAASPWITPAQESREGWAAICWTAQPWCQPETDRLAAANPGAQQYQLQLTRWYLGTPSKPGRVTILLAPSPAATRRHPPLKVAKPGEPNPAAGEPLGKGV